eukprot:scaffold77_cov116-Isochrysis_galbana.AAC.13
MCHWYCARPGACLDHRCSVARHGLTPRPPTHRRRERAKGRRPQVIPNPPPAPSPTRQWID